MLSVTLYGACSCIRLPIARLRRKKEYRC